ncbi:MAG: N-acyl-D-amino-acid deacylase family protein [Candidatus Binatia bacterium]
MWDLLIKGGRVVDGSGLPGFTADIAIQDGRVARVGRVDEAARRVIDADGLVVAPGFIDVHTHYDAQLDWDPVASPSSWHGVTSVIAGNCGFTLAPARPGDTEWLALMLSRVEGMSAAALGAGMQWYGGGFGDFWGRLEGRIAVNAGGYVGHSAVRRYVMGDDASARAARAEEIGAMQQLVRDAMREGALGFSSSQLDIHVAHDGREVPSNHATAAELVALAAVLAEFGRGALEFIPRSFVEGYNDADRELLRSLARVSGRPIELNVLTPLLPAAPDGWLRSLEFAREAFRDGLRLHPMFPTNKLGAHLALDTTFLFDEMPVFRDALTQPAAQRERRLRDPAVRQQMRAALADPTGRAFVFAWQIVEVEWVRDAVHADLVGRMVGDLAEERGQDPLDFFLDLSLAEDLQTQFALEMPPNSYFDDLIRQLLRDPIVMAGSSDAGAHLLSFVGADYTTRLLSQWVPEALPLETAIARLTAMPAMVHGLYDRGMLRPGLAADVVLFDPTRLAVGRTRLARDFPAESPRFVVDAEGYVALIVNGQVVLEHGRHTGALPGQILRG